MNYITRLAATALLFSFIFKSTNVIVLPNEYTLSKSAVNSCRKLFEQRMQHKKTCSKRLIQMYTIQRKREKVREREMTKEEIFLGVI